MKQMALCMTRPNLPIALVDQINLLPFKLMNVANDQFHMINREICDAKKTDNFDQFWIGKMLPQVLPYAVIKHKGKILTYSRSKTGGEERLHAKRSIGFGGHIDLADLEGLKQHCHAACIGLERELLEELNLAVDIDDAMFTQILIDQTNEVGEVHLGFPIYFELSKAQFTSLKNNHEIVDLQWVAEDALHVDIDKYENWSKVIIERGHYE